MLKTILRWHDQFYREILQENNYLNASSLDVADALSFCDIEEMTAERGLKVYHARINP